MNQSPLIIGFVADLMFTSKIVNVAQHLGYQIKWIESATDISEEDDINAPAEVPGEQLHGRNGRLFDKITQWQPALLLFDLTNQAIPWQQWIPTLKSSPATRRLPILCFGPHEDVALMTLAQELGADAVLARSRFTAAMPSLLQKWAKIPDHAQLHNVCQEPLAPLARKGIELFNAGKYFECHEELEDAWNEDKGPGRELYRGLLQIGVAYLQIERGNQRGAIKMLLRARQWLDPLPATCRGVNIAKVRQDANTLYKAIETIDDLSDLDPNLLQPINYHPS